ncbi:PREDICTED: major royal jelly protein 3-like isoform X1 [Trachymyrmex septentrionalis]|uniref:major royal jelly protein 3-like isoform X1 n=1 Tax=Trachymyrmex septentrionalis TaxID=34720 RepID=UPI00084F1FED|nr:PREDICTED: major royal jelly protein 3-like isoform X1 [Trachymyrmex septentrionalis]
MKYLLCILLIMWIATVTFGIKVNYIYEWKYVDFIWESNEQKKDAINSGTYNRSACTLFDVDKAKDGRIFVTATRELGPGSPASLATVTNETGPGGPLLRPYPNWSWHNSNCTCDNIVSVVRVNIRCNHIFALDSGKIGPDHICNPKLLIFNLKDDTLVKTIYIPFDIASNATGFGSLITPFVYIPKKCTQFLHEMIVFMADIQGKGLVVYDSSVKSMCRVESDYMIPTENLVSIANQKFPYDGGILSAVTFYDELYYVTSPGMKIYKIKIKSLLKCPNKEEANKNTKIAIKIPSDSGQIASAGHSIFYSDTDGNAILGTNVFKKPDKNTVILAQDDKKLQAISSLKSSYYWNRLIGLSDKFHRFVLGTVNLNEVNIYYFEMDLTEIQKKMDSIS